MAKSVSVAAVVSEIERRMGIVDPPVKIIQIAAVAAKELMPNRSIEECFDYSEKNKDKIKKELAARIGSEINNTFGYFSKISISDASDEYLHGSCYEIKNDNDSAKAAKKDRSKIFHIESNINSLDELEFEIFCGRILSLLGVDDPIVTKSSNDQGIDFFGVWSHESYIKKSVLSYGMERQLRTWIFGQAKKYYKSVVSTSEIRELVGSVELAKSKAFSSSVTDLSGHTVRPCDPVFQFFITTGRATSGVMELMRQSGTIYMDGHLAAVFLADRASSLGIDFSVSEEFRNWLVTRD